MIEPAQILLAVFVLTLLLGAVLVLRPGVTRDRGGKVLAFSAILALPVVAGWSGTAYHLEQSKKTEFCLSCHVMNDHGRSLYVDDPEFLAASHFQNSRVPIETACYACHTQYTMYGDLQSKLRGLRHVYAYYIGSTPEPEELQLFSPYHNRECLYCHEGARSFEESSFHNLTAEMPGELKSNELSCIVCHELVHEVERLDEVNFWERSDGQR